MVRQRPQESTARRNISRLNIFRHQFLPEAIAPTAEMPSVSDVTGAGACCVLDAMVDAGVVPDHKKQLRRVPSIFCGQAAGDSSDDMAMSDGEIVNGLARLVPTELDSDDNTEAPLCVDPYEVCFDGGVAVVVAATVAPEDGEAKVLVEAPICS